MQGVFVAGLRCPTKKMLKETVATNPKKVRIEATSFFGNEYDGKLSDAPTDETFTVVGPDPYTKRMWYANIKFKVGKDGVGKWVVT